MKSIPAHPEHPRLFPPEAQLSSSAARTAHERGTVPCSREAAAFSLIELLIAILIATLLGGIVLYLFGQTQRMVRTSLSTASVATTAAAMDSRLRMDAASLLGPNRTQDANGGCLVIVPALRLGYIPLANGQMSKNKVRLRCDQLVFMSYRKPEQGHPWLSLIPPDQNTVTEAAAQPTDRSSWEARIWYGALRDANASPTPDSPDNPYWAAHLWPVGRQAKLFVGAHAATSGDCTVTGAGDTVAGTLTAFKDAAIAGNWTDADYLGNLISTGIPNDQGDYTNQPAVNARVDLKALERGQAEQGIQFGADVIQNTLKLFDHCSEIVVQWSGDLDKDGRVDVYPPGHPLAGSVIWYPEELHDKGAWFNANIAPNLDGWTASPKTDIGAKYQAILDNPWPWTFDLSNTTKGGAFSTSTSRFGGRAFPAGFQFDYGDTHHTTSPQPTGTPSIPAPYVFKFDDDQFRLVRYGFRQDGSVYANQWNGKPLPDAVGGGLHAFPYPPLAAAPTKLEANYSPSDNRGAVIDPYTSQFYQGQTAPDGPYPRAATAAAANGQNFGDLMGDQPLNLVSTATVNLKITGPGGEIYRTGGNGILNDANEFGQWVKKTVSTPLPRLIYPLPTTTLELVAPGTAPTAPVPPAIYSAEQIAALQAAPVWPFYAGGELVMINQIGQTIASVAKPAGDPTPDTPAADLLPVVQQNSAHNMDQRYGATNNYTRSYTDLWAEYLKPINPPAAGEPDKRATLEDWRMPQSDWPRMLRIRFRLHDAQGLVNSYSDEFLVNGRDNDGDGVVNNPEESHMSGMWFEYILSIPAGTDPNHPAYPMDLSGAPLPTPAGYVGPLPYLNPGPRNH